MTIPAGVADTILEPRIKAETAKIPRSGIVGRTALLQQLFNKKTVLDLVVWCVEYRLTYSFEACKKYVKQCLTQRVMQTRLDWCTTGFGGHELAQTINRLTEKGHVTEAATFGAELLERMRLMD